MAEGLENVLAGQAGFGVEDQEPDGHQNGKQVATAVQGGGPIGLEYLIPFGYGYPIAVQFEPWPWLQGADESQDGAHPVAVHLQALILVRLVNIGEQA